MTPDLANWKTERLSLRRPTEADLPDLLAMYRDPVVMATLGGLRDEEWTRAAITRTTVHWEQHGFGWWIARDPATGAFLGRGGLRRLFVGSAEEFEIGYGFVTSAWGRGLATELAREAARVGFEVLQAPDIVCFTSPTNLKSRRVMQKVGFRFERDIVYVNMPHVLYRRTSWEWFHPCRT
jgi:RimJ/RimL family protein N-acetyltransferase